MKRIVGAFAALALAGVIFAPSASAVAERKADVKPVVKLDRKAVIVFEKER